MTDLPSIWKAVRRQAGVSAGLWSAFAGAALIAASPLSGAEPRIDHIEPFEGDQVTIHFYTEANRTYTLQYRNNAATNGVPASGTWSNLYRVPSVPFEQHFVIVDTRTNHHRFYRFCVTP
jgi:hypothetical protein